MQDVAAIVNFAAWGGRLARAVIEEAAIHSIGWAATAPRSSNGHSGRYWAPNRPFQIVTDTAAAIYQKSSKNRPNGEIKRRGDR